MSGVPAERMSVWGIAVVLTVGTVFCIVFWRLMLPILLVILVVVTLRGIGRRRRGDTEPR